MAERGGVDSLNIVIGANTEALKKGLDDAVKAFQGTSQSLEKQAAKAQKSMERLLKGANDPGANLKQQNRNLTNLAGAYMQMGEAGSAGFKKVTEQAIAARRQMEDVNDAIMAADLEGRAKLAAMGFAQATQAIAGMQGAMHLLGLDTKTAAEATATLQSLMAISSGIEGIVALEGTMDALSKRLPIVNSLMKTFQMLMRPGPLLLIGAAAAALYTIFSNMPAKIARVNYEQKALLGLTEAMKGAVTDEQVQLAKLGGVLQSNTATQEQRRMALKKLQELYPTYFKDLDLEKAKTGDIATAINQATEALKKKAMVAAIDKRMTDLASKEIEKQILLQQKQAEFQKFDRKKGEVGFQNLRSEIATIQGEMMTIQAERNSLIKIANDVGADFTKSLAEGIKTGGGAGSKAPVKKAVEEIQFQVLDAMRTMNSGAVSNVSGAPTVSIPLNVNFKTGDLTGRVGQIVQDINSALDSGIKQMAINMAGALGDLAMNIVAGAEDPLAKFGDALLSTLAGFMQTLGQAMMAAGLASQKFQALLFTQPAGAIIAGAALIVAAGAVKGIMQKGIEGRKSKGSTSSNNQPAGIRPFADGGIISGPTLGLMGEYPGARSNPEVVAPLNKLKDMIGGGGNLTTRVSGQDLLIMLDRAETNRGRVR
jgi:hypothetical protein